MSTLFRKYGPVPPKGWPATQFLVYVNWNKAGRLEGKKDFNRDYVDAVR